MSLQKEKLIEDGQGLNLGVGQLNHDTSEEQALDQAPRVAKDRAQRSWVSPRVESLGRVAEMTLSGFGGPGGGVGTQSIA